MFLEDYHIHSSASNDAEDTMLDMALAAGERGINSICFTDHIDLDHYTTGHYNPGYMDNWPEALAQFDEARRDAPSLLHLMLGMELSAANHYPELAGSIAKETEDLDFIIASIHNVTDTPDFYTIDYDSEEHCRFLNNIYMREHLELARLDCFDVIGHIGYSKRYMLRAGFKSEVNIDEHGSLLEELFKTLIHKGKGIELNTSGMRHPGIAGPIPSLPILKLYRRMGGEIITVGSDAHRVEDAGSYIETGFDLLKTLGFKYVTRFKKRIPEFIRI